MAAGALLPFISVTAAMRVLAWALFDFANTFFAVTMLSFFFPLWITEDLGAKELWFSVSLGVSMAAVALVMPLCGAVSDATQERMRFLRWSTYGCIAAVMLVGMTSRLVPALVLFGVANFCYQLGTIFYDALLWRVSDARSLGRTSGVGSAFGYLGSMAGLLLLWPVVERGGRQASFLPSALLFLVFALPSFLLIREPHAAGPLPWASLMRTAALRMAITVRQARGAGGAWTFLWAFFFSSNAINTVLVFMGIYAKKVLGLTEPEMIRFFVFSQAFAIAGALSLSQLMPWCGPKRTLTLIWIGWISALGVLTFFHVGHGLWVIGPVFGFCLGGTWATSRVLIVQLSPKDQLAEMFGLAGLFGRASSILGPMLWGAIVWDPTRYQYATGMLMVLLAIGLSLLRRVAPLGSSATEAIS